MKVEFTLNSQNEIKLEYEGKTSKTTVINMTNHTYWNMSGNFKRNLYPQLLKINALSYLPVIDMVDYIIVWFTIQIPTGEVRSVQDSPFDYSISQKCEQALVIDGGGKPGLDHCFCLEGEGLKEACV